MQDSYKVKVCWKDCLWLRTNNRQSPGEPLVQISGHGQRLSLLNKSKERAKKKKTRGQSRKLKNRVKSRGGWKNPRRETRRGHGLETHRGGEAIKHRWDTLVKEHVITGEQDACDVERDTAGEANKIKQDQGNKWDSPNKKKMLTSH